MPASIQNQIISVSGQASSAKYCAANEAMAAGAKGATIGVFKAKGYDPVYTLTSEQVAAWRGAVLPVWDKWVGDMESKKMPGEAIISDVKVFTQKYK